MSPVLIPKMFPKLLKQVAYHDIGKHADTLSCKTRLSVEIIIEDQHCQR